MTTRADDELVVPHFQDRLWDELRALHASAGGAEAADEAADEAVPVRGPGGRRRPRLLVAAAAVAVAAAVSGAVLLGGRDDGATVMAPAGQATTTGEPAPAEVPRPDGIVLVETRNAEGHVHRAWVDEVTGAKRDLSLDAAGNPWWDSAWLSIREEGDEVVVQTRDVDHCFREYQDGEIRVPVETARQAFPETWRVEGAPQTMLDEEAMVAEGIEVVDGRELLRYRDVENDAVLWLDPETHDFVRRRFSAGGDAEQSETYEYLARTPENLAVLQPEVPPGYTTPWTDHTNEEREAAGCL